MTDATAKLVAYVEQKDAERAILKIKWLPIDRSNPMPTKIQYSDLSGATAKVAGEYLSQGAEIRPYEEIPIPLSREIGKPLWITIKAEKADGADVYLPPQKAIPIIPQRVQVLCKSFYKGSLQGKEVTAWVSRGEQLRLHFKQGDGAHEMDWNVVAFNNGYLMASSKDSAIAMSNDGTEAWDVGDLTTSEHGNFKCECKIVSLHPQSGWPQVAPPEGGSSLGKSLIAFLSYLLSPSI